MRRRGASASMAASSESVRRRGSSSGGLAFSSGGGGGGAGAGFGGSGTGVYATAIIVGGRALHATQSAARPTNHPRAILYLAWRLRARNQSLRNRSVSLFARKDRKQYRRMRMGAFDPWIALASSRSSSRTRRAEPFAQPAMRGIRFVTLMPD